MEFLKAVASTYVGILRRLGSILAVVLMSAVASALVVYPLWFFATRNTRAYTTVVLVTLVVGLGVAVVGRAVTRMRVDRSYLSRSLLPGMRTVGSAVVVLVGIYGAVWLFARGLYGAAVPLTVLLVAAVGLLGRARRS